MRALRLAYVLPVGRRRRDPLDELEAFPHNQRLLATLADHHGVQAHAVWTNARHAVVRRDAVTHHFTPTPARVVAKLRPDVVHLNGLVFPRLACQLRLAAGRRAVLVAQHHGEQPGTGRSRLAQRAVCPLIDRYLFCGLPGQAEPWIRAGILDRRAPRAEVLEASSDLRAPPRPDGETAPDAMAADGVPPGDPVVHRAPLVLWVGRLQPGKDPLTAIEAFARFAALRPGARLRMVAPQPRPLAEPVQRALAALRADAIDADLLGPLSQAELARWYGAADVLLSTSRHEGSGYAVIEAVGCGCPPVLSELPSHRAIAGSIGRYFAPGDAAGAVRALREATEAAGPAARAQVSAHFERCLRWDHVADQLMAAYRTAP